MDKPERTPMCPNIPRACSFLLVAASFGAFGFLFVRANAPSKLSRAQLQSNRSHTVCAPVFLFRAQGWHWWVLFLVAAQTAAERRACVMHFFLHVAALLITALGGGWCRSGMSTYVPCADNQTMTRLCLFHTQPLDYSVIYVMHFVSGGALLSMFVLDGIQILGWTLKDRMTTLYSPYPLFPSYAAVLGVATLIVTITWTAIIDWDDATVGRLAVILLILIGVVGAVSSVCLCLLARARSVEYEPHV